MSSQSVKLAKLELDQSLNILKTHGCSDFFPPAFEIEAIVKNWDKIWPVLEGVDLLCYSPRSAPKMVAPRQRYTTRSIKLIDPIDFLLITGLCQRIVSPIQKARASLSKRCVYSCKFVNSKSGGFFDFHADYIEFRLEMEAQLELHSYIATADINDFYPRLYLHRLENALDSMLSPGSLETRCVMRFIENWAEGTSYGVPVGPHFSHVLAEATLHEVDSFLLSHNVAFIRFVDDYYLFGQSESECLRGLYLLGSRLQDTQGLSLNSAKTRVWQREDLKCRMDLDGRPDAKLRKDIIEKIFGGDLYSHADIHGLNEEQKELLDEFDLAESLRLSLNTEALADFSSIKFILAVLTAVSRPELTEILLDNLGRLYPVAPSVSRFLGVLDQIQPHERIQIGARILDFVANSSYVPEFQRMWLLDPFVRSKEWRNVDAIRRIAATDQNRLVRRQAVLALGQSADRSAILDAKVRTAESTDWEQRAIVYACRNLPVDEKDAFILSLNVSKDWKIDNLLMKAVVESIK